MAGLYLKSKFLSIESKNDTMRPIHLTIIQDMPLIEGRPSAETGVLREEQLRSLFYRLIDKLGQSTPDEGGMPNMGHASELNDLKKRREENFCGYARYLIQIRSLAPEIVAEGEIDEALLGTSLDTMNQPEALKGVLIACLQNTVSKEKWVLAESQIEDLLSTLPQAGNILPSVLFLAHNKKAPPEFIEKITNIIKDSGTIELDVFNKTLEKVQKGISKPADERLKNVVKNIAAAARGVFADDQPDLGQKYLDLLTRIDPEFQTDSIDKTVRLVGAARLIATLEGLDARNTEGRRDLLKQLKPYATDDPTIAKMIETELTKIDKEAPVFVDAKIKKEADNRVKKLKVYIGRLQEILEKEVMDWDNFEEEVAIATGLVQSLQEAVDNPDATLITTEAYLNLEEIRLYKKKPFKNRRGRLETFSKKLEEIDPLQSKDPKFADKQRNILQRVQNTLLNITANSQSETQSFGQIKKQKAKNAINPSEASALRDLINQGRVPEVKLILRGLSSTYSEDPTFLKLSLMIALNEQATDIALDIANALRPHVNPAEYREILQRINTLSRTVQNSSRSLKSNIWDSIGSREPINALTHKVTRRPKPGKED